MKSSLLVLLLGKSLLAFLASVGIQNPTASHATAALTAQAEECFADLENDPFAVEMNEVPLFGEDTIVMNDRPVWTTLLMVFYSLALSMPPSPDSDGNEINTVPYGMCVPDEFGLMRCNAALVPYFVDLTFPAQLNNDTLPAMVNYFSIIPYSCMEQGGTMVHTSFTTDCLPIEGVADRVEFFGIPQCIPASCNIRRANRYWKARIESDLEELKTGAGGFPGGNECTVTYRMETRRPVKKGVKL